MVVFSGSRSWSMSPEEFERRVVPAYHGSWGNCRERFAADVFDSRRVAELREELAAVGFRNPVVIFRRRRAPWRFGLADGMHRAVAAMESGAPVPVATAYPGNGPEFFDEYRVHATVPEDRDLVDAVLGASSFRSRQGQWILGETASSWRDTVDILLPRVPEDQRGEIAGQLRQRLEYGGIFPVTVEFLAPFDPD